MAKAKSSDSSRKSSAHNQSAQEIHEHAALLAVRHGIDLCDPNREVHADKDGEDMHGDLQVIHDMAHAQGAYCPGHEPADGQDDDMDEEEGEGETERMAMDEGDMDEGDMYGINDMDEDEESERMNMYDDQDDGLACGKEKEKMCSASGMAYAPSVVQVKKREKERMAARSVPVEDEIEEDAEDESVQTDTDSGKGREKARMARDSAEIKLERYRKQAEAAEAKTIQLEKEVEELKRDKRLARYERDLIQLEAEGYEFDRGEELDDVADLSQEAFDKHKKRIKARYSRTIVDAKPLRIVGEPPKRDGSDPDEFTTEDLPKLVRYCKEKGITIDATDPDSQEAAIEAYKAEKKKARTG